jgi:hypothetical protein
MPPSLSKSRAEQQEPGKVYSSCLKMRVSASCDVFAAFDSDRPQLPPRHLDQL